MTINLSSSKLGVKPTLLPKLGYSESGAEQSEDRILSNLTTGPVSSTSKKSGLPIVRLLIITLAVYAGLWISYRYWSESALSQSRHENALGKNVGSDRNSPDKAPTSQIASITPSEAAQIVNESANADKSQSGIQTKLTEALEKDAQLPAAAIEKALKSPAASVESADTKANSIVKKQGPSNKEKTTKSAQIPTGVTPDDKDVKPEQKVAMDKDVKLLSALMAHTNEARGTGVPKAEVTDSIKKQAPTQPAAVSEQPTAPSTATLLKTCGSLSFLDNILCRNKTCEGIWETDPSCKAVLSTKNSSAVSGSP